MRGRGGWQGRGWEVDGRGRQGGGGEVDGRGLEG